MRGGARVGDTVELPELKVQKKVKSMQMFRCGAAVEGETHAKGVCCRLPRRGRHLQLAPAGSPAPPPPRPVQAAGAGVQPGRPARHLRDAAGFHACRARAGLRPRWALKWRRPHLRCPPRCLPAHASCCSAAHPAVGPATSLIPPAGSVPTFDAAVAAVEKIRFYGGDVRSRSKMHVTVGPATGASGLSRGMGGSGGERIVPAPPTGTATCACILPSPTPPPSDGGAPVLRAARRRGPAP